MTTSSSTYVRDYLAELSMYASELPVSQRAELVSGISEYLEEAAARGEMNDDASVKKVLARLGEPERLVQSAVAHDQPARGSGAPRTSAREERWVWWITLGSLLPIVGWLTGVLAAWRSTSVTRGERWALLMFVPGGPLAAFIFANWIRELTQYTCESSVFGPARGLSGAAVDATVQSGCTDAVLHPVIGIALIVLVLGASVGVPLTIWRRSQAR